jgi:hypothetical protein
MIHFVLYVHLQGWVVMDFCLYCELMGDRLLRLDLGQR